MEKVVSLLESCADEIPACVGVYRLYFGKDLLHIGMAAGAATLRSELARHARGDYGPDTQRADRVDWEVVPDDLYAYEAFVALYNEAIYCASERTGEDWAPSTSRCHGGETGVSYGSGSLLGSDRQTIHRGDGGSDCPRVERQADVADAGQDLHRPVLAGLAEHRLEAGAAEELILSAD